MRRAHSAHCNRCLGNRWHSLLHQTRDDWEGDFPGSETYEMLQCQGCDQVTVRHTHKFEGLEPSVSYYPPAVSRKPPAWLKGPQLVHVPVDVLMLAQEVYSALQNGARTLASIGIRTILDIIMTEKLGDIGGFEAKLRRFRADGHISMGQQAQLEHIIDAGSASAHRGYRPEAEDVEIAVDIMEMLVRTLYVDPVRAAELGTRVPPRKP